MKYKNLIIEKKEYLLLKRLMNLTVYFIDMPKDVIRFNSTITIVSKKGWHKIFKLVSPAESDIKNNWISILTPMGAAVIGYAEGDTLVWEFPSGEQKLTIEKVDQENKYINVNLVL